MIEKAVIENAADRGASDEGELFAALIPDLRDSRGVSYHVFRKTLQPSYSIIWMQILGAWTILFLVAMGMIWIEGVIVFADTTDFVIIGFVATLGALAIAYLITFLNLWFHEAAHFNIHPDKRMNDFFANLFLGGVRGQDIKRYRSIHFGHHAKHGGTDDPERSYFEPLNLKFLLGSLLGIRAISVLQNRSRTLQKEQMINYLNKVFVVAICLHLSLIALALKNEWFVFTIAWVIGIVFIHPFLGSVRQLLEHRKPNASGTEDYNVVPHGPYTRVFWGGPITKLFGGAGFDRHLIHHWDASLSCTRFAEMENFLMESQIADFYRFRTTTYWRAFRELFGK